MPFDPVVTVRVPATTANLGPGFDCLGLALDIHNTVALSLAEAISVEVTGFGAEGLTRGADHLVVSSAARVAQVAGILVPGWRLRQHNEIPLARGMGSSSAAIVGGLVAANELLQAGLDDKALLDLAVAIEGHPDNVAPALLGGLTVCCTDEEGLGVARFDPPGGLCVVLAIPDYEVSTEAARKVMPREIPHGDGVFNTCHSTAVLAAFLSGDMDLLGQAMKDRLHEPYRTPLVRGMGRCVAAAREAGAVASALSGSGPTIIAFAEDNCEAVAVGVQAAMLAALAAEGVTAQGRIARPSATGAEVVDGGV
jgi:homoserine kinase